ncbi:MAG: cold shock domain-containing protein [Bacteroidetes bacterium]|jgi:CspA family cold shock protein|nr:cold shock domain-containing protein [Bacteroidota bacterium]
MRKGRVKFYNEKSGFGFVTDLENGNEYYVQEKYLLEKVAEADEVVFEIKILKRGPVAINVRKKES